MRKILIGLISATVLITLTACKPGVYADLKPAPKGQPSKSISQIHQQALEANTTTD